MSTRRSFITRAAQADIVGCAPPVLAQGRKIRLVSMTDLAGVERASGNGIRQGISACVNAFNAGRNSAGTVLEYSPLDHEFSVERTKALALQCQSDPSILSVINVLGTGHTMAAAETAPDLPIVGPITGSVAPRQRISPNVFWVRASYEDEIDKLVRHAALLGLTSIGLLHSSDAFGLGLLAAFNKTMAALELKPAVVAATPSVTSSEIQGAVDQLAAARPQLLLVALAAMLPPVVKALRGRGITSSIYGLSIGASESNIAALGDQARGLGFSLVVPSPFSTKYEIVRRYDADMKAAGVTERSVFSLEGYISARIAIEGVRRAGASPSRKSLIAGLESLVNFDLGGFRVNYGPGNRIGGSFVDIAVIGAGGRVLS